MKYKIFRCYRQCAPDDIMTILSHCAAAAAEGFMDAFESRPNVNLIETPNESRVVTIDIDSGKIKVFDVLTLPDSHLALTD